MGDDARRIWKVTKPSNILLESKYQSPLKIPGSRVSTSVVCRGPLNVAADVDRFLRIGLSERIWLTGRRRVQPTKKWTKLVRPRHVPAPGGSERCYPHGVTHTEGPRVSCSCPPSPQKDPQHCHHLKHGGTRVMQ